MLHNVAAATPPAAFVREPAKAEAYGGTALYVRLLGHGHGGTVDWNQTNDPCSPWSALHNACMGLPTSCVTRRYSFMLSCEMVGASRTRETRRKEIK